MSNGIITAIATTVGSLSAMIGYNHFNNKTDMIKSQFRRCQEIRNSLIGEKISDDHQMIFLKKMGVVLIINLLNLLIIICNELLNMINPFVKFIVELLLC